MKALRVKITFDEELLGTASANAEIHEQFIASKAPNAKSLEEEVAAVGVEEVVDKSMTVFPRNEEGKPILYDYQIRGFFKDSAGFIKKIASDDDKAASKSKKNNEEPAYKTFKLTAHKKAVDGLIFVKPRMIELKLPDGAKITHCQRPLRAATPQGERIALANSEAVPAGTTCEFEVICLKDDHMDMVKEWLDYGEYHGIGQWRNSGKGKFHWELIEES